MTAGAAAALLVGAGAMVGLGCEPKPTRSTPAKERPPMQTLLTFAPLSDAFRAIDDRVMGGVSQSALEPLGTEVAAFRGGLSLAQGGGFASVRADGLALDLSPFEALVLRVRGDGKRYKLRLHDQDRRDGVSFQAAFDTTAGQWQSITLPLSTFEPTWRGRLMPDAAPLARDRIVALGLMISDRQAGAFSLEVAWLAGR